MAPHSSDPTVLWRMKRGRATAHATLFPGERHTTVTWYFNGVMDRAENFDSMDIALFRSDDVKRTLMDDGWTEDV